MSADTLILVLACDLTPDGSQLGPHTVARLEEGLRLHRKTDSQLVVAAPFAPQFTKQQPHTVAELMGRWLCKSGCNPEEVIVLNAQTSNTRGELRVFYELVAKQYVIVTSSWHLRRAMAIARQVASPERFAKTTPHKAEDHATLRQRMLELPKWLLVLWIPERFHERLTRLAALFVGNTAW